MTLLNWPPSRGPEPVTTRVMVYANPAQEDVAPRDRELDAEEKEDYEAALEIEGLIDQAMAEGKSVSEALGFATTPEVRLAPESECDETDLPEEEGYTELHEPEKESLSGTFFCNYHVATVANLTLEQADRLLFVARPETESAPCPEECEIEEDHQHERVLGMDPHCTWGDYKPAPLTIELSYPLGIGSKITINPFVMKFKTEGEEPWERGPYLTAGYVLWMLAQEYKRIYTEHEHYKVWGHAIGDLYFEGFDIAEDRSVHLRIGS